MTYRLILTVIILMALVACDAKKPVENHATANAPKLVDEHDIFATCNSCHGEQGVSNAAGVPFLAGQHSEYLLSAIRDYVVGSRPDESMRDAVVELTDDERLAVAEHYAKMDTPWKGVEKAKPVSGQHVDRRAIAAGKRIARQCTSCHGGKGISTRPGVPNIAGLQADYFKRSLRAYLSGGRTGADIMKNFKYSLSKQDIVNLAAYFASLKPGKTPLATPGNVKWGRISSASCVGCHGANGNSINADIPSLAGQNGRYLKIAMKHYRNGERNNAMMKKAVHKFSDTKIGNIAAYYSRQTPASPASGESSKPGVFDPIADGARLAATCDGCHGKNGNGGQRGIPRLTGLAPDYLFSAIRAYKTSQRKNETMQMFAASLSDVAIEKVSLFYATQTPAENTRPGKGDIEAGKKVSEACAGCHGDAGISADAKVPSLAGQDARYLRSAILEYANEKRHVEAMTDVVKALDKQAVKNVASYYASLSGVQPEVRLPESLASWVEKCERCHGLAGYSDQLDKPILTGQRQSYLVKALIGYRDGTRRHSTMNAMLGVISLSEIDALAAYYARQSKPEKLTEKLTEKGKLTAK